jgi:two-component system response regulator RegX3
MSARILLVDDDAGIVDIVTYRLENDGFDVDIERDGTAALKAASSRTYDVVLLDIMLPDLSGVEVCRRLRADRNTVPIIMLTAKDAELDRVLGLEAGADDYVTKPFSSPELVSRIRALLRRRDFDRATPAALVHSGGVRLDLDRHEVVVDGDAVDLTPSEFKVLVLLAEQPERVVSRRQIMEHLWMSSYVGDEHAADVHISNLRRKIERDPSAPKRIVTVRSFGYKLVPT